MGGYELVRSDDAAAGATGTDLESGASASKASPPSTAPSTTSPAARQPRLVSLDVFRGITVLLMIIVDDAGGFLPSLNHSPWDGVTIADFVMPFFLFIVGVSLTLAYKRVPDKLEATKKAVLRALKLFCLGLVLQGGFFHGVHSLTFGVDLTKIRLMGILQRIAIAYLLAAICEIWLKGDDDVDSGYGLLRRYRYQLFVGLVLSIAYTILLYGIYVPDWEYKISGPGSTEKSFSVKCGVRGDTGPACNAVGMVDRTILGIDHLYRRPVYARTKECSINYPENGPLPPDAPSWCQAPFDPEGLLSSVMAIVTCLIGLQFGHIIIHFEKHRGRIINWLIPSFSMLALAFLMDFSGMRMNKPLYTMSYTLATAGAAGLLFAGIYALVGPLKPDNIYYARVIQKQASPGGAISDGAKCRRSGDGELSPSASASRAVAEDSDERCAGGEEEEDKRRTARLMRNRESAQLSRQRKKRYVEELEEKVKSMHSVINDLNSKISFIAAENATLRQKLGGAGVSSPPPGVYPPPPLPGIHFPWVPGYAMRPHGSHVPLVPIPRLKPQQAAAAGKVSKKPEVKKSADSKSKTKTKTKKVASISLLGLLFVALVFGAFVPGFNHSLGMRGMSDNMMFGNFGHSDARVFSVTNHGKGPKGGLNSSDVISTDPGMITGHADGAGQKHRAANNSSEILPALLYVPRNGKHVKINGNLIIHSVLASEKAVAHKASNGQSVKDRKETSVAIARYLSPPGTDLNSKETLPPDAPLPQWFREGMEGPVLNSGMCSEVFQFDISAASAKSGGIIPASPTVNSSSVNATQKIPKPAPAYGGKLKNRRIMYNEAIPLTGKTVNNTEPRSFNSTSESSKVPDSKPASSVIVSVLADPREAGNGDGDPRVSTKPLSRIFVVVLLDGVRYVTYSCTLPFKSATPHLVN